VRGQCFHQVDWHVAAVVARVLRHRPALTLVKRERCEDGWVSSWVGAWVGEWMDGWVGGSKGVKVLVRVTLRERE
jgi:hypothetical protein